MDHTISSLATIVTPIWVSLTKPDDMIRFLLTDSRRLVEAKSTLFFAITTSRNDGHHYVEDLFKKGVRNFVVTNTQLFPNLLGHANFIQVENTINALQKIAAAHRAEFQIPILGITGSNGKTIVKEWLTQMILTKLCVCASPDSYNSQIGVPLSVWQLNDYHQLGLFEAGISQPHEMESLQKIIKPNYGIFTNIGQAHSENFGTLEEKTIEKTKLFRETEVLIYCRDHELIHKVVKENLKSKTKLITWGENPESTIRIIQKTRNGKTTSLTLVNNQQKIQLELPVSDMASIENAMHCYTFLDCLGWDDKTKAEAILQLHPIPMRLEMMEGINQCTLINDTYNSDINSLEVALDYLNRQAGVRPTAVILSDILQSGQNPAELYDHVAYLLNLRNVGRVIGIGSEISKFGGLFPMQKNFYVSTQQFIDEFPFSSLQNDVILLKGARSFEFENITRILRRRSHQTVLEINLENLIHNFNFYKQKTKPGTLTLAMVKAFGYGSGMHEIASILQQNGVDCFGVAYPDEGAQLRRAGIQTPIMVMNPENDNLDIITQFHLEPEIYSQTSLTQLAHYLSSRRPDYLPFPIHLKFDTGMHRLGFLPEQLDEALMFLKQHPNIKVKSVFSHLAASEDPLMDDFTRKQAEIFEEMAQKTIRTLEYPVIRHLVNSAGIIRFPEYHFEMVRIGLGLYGIGHDEKTQRSLQLVSKFSSVISQIKTIRKGEGIGYNLKWRAPADTRIGIVTVGYADGLRRELSSKGFCFHVRGHLAPIIGAISMDMCAIDLTGIAATEGDPVIIFDNADTIHQLSRLLNTIPYEILTSISQRVRRVYLMG
ncbi:MAG TPA: bifunctional UDP-N-acetylmuramoyl-tripeptide:D-alanyl-D-alanine ligase/alanine racemase [Bacteroidales bacterium]|jgi:alanine racemase|nr:bifunctional UDP-N-acetylmuramoyl-tripeptide:D-alanyl-D-alanine ligase/alanine racemase [Bacteroidales bacterium]MDI9574456.1 bifunctional UDP-N-acetylmuramoyl-tripeptide:D-alanyl-D-alanine ligase/alanine racemase [Bacteroidota bacterium]MBP9511372.1 bifunctional UDP-N-acetylmuramoyl-tripeptide:D-alanyl-D-alanine ligase/alanine racemase [Bacteroidales bacterium]MBP9587612.1 bifunctional UDP-N-acetylmuramoyl-tripeptide:D-alanyl-D-alanine ligase/alanine racemase [Bacteroidales bacterium]NMD167